MKYNTKVYDFWGGRKIFILISAVLMLSALAATLIRGLEVSIEFKGGTIVSYSYEGDIDTGEVENKAKDILGTPVTIQTGDVIGSDTAHSLTISFSYENGGFTPELQTSLTTSLQELYPDGKVEVLESNDVSPTAGKEFFLKCLVAAGFATLILVIYIALRFKKISGWSAGVFAIVALVHDLLVAYGTFVAFGFEINANFMAVILTILGYSVNDTMVIYDRIRENQRLLPNSTSIAELVNVSTSQSLRRSLRTSITTVSAMLIISIVAAITGVSSIQSFSIPLIAGMISGSYSSLTLCPTLWIWWNEKRGKHTIADIAKK